MNRPLDRDAIERVVRRALELEQIGVDGIDGIDDEALIAAAVEAGVDTGAVRASLAIERLGEKPEASTLDRVAGPAQVVCELQVETPPGEAIRRLDEWFTVGHHLRREYRTDLTGEWSKRADIAAGVQRRLRAVSGDAELGTVRRVQATAASIDDRSTLIRVIIDRSVARRAAVGTAGGVGVATLAGAAAVSTVASPLAVIVTPGLAVAGATAWASKRAASRNERQLRRLLHQVAVGERPGIIGSRVARRLTRRETT